VAPGNRNPMMVENWYFSNELFTLAKLFFAQNPRRNVWVSRQAYLKTIANQWFERCSSVRLFSKVPFGSGRHELDHFGFWFDFFRFLVDHWEYKLNNRNKSALRNAKRRQPHGTG
jgi:hypothetical protein